MWAAARVHLTAAGASDTLFSYAVDYSMYVDLRMATTAAREWLTPYEMIKGTPPAVDYITPFYTKTYVKVPVAKRKQLEKEGHPLVRAEEGRLIGFHGPYSTTPKALPAGNRVVHSINVTYDAADHTVPAPLQEAWMEHPLDAVELGAGGGLQEANDRAHDSVQPDFGSPPQQQADLSDAYVAFGPMPEQPPEYFSPSDDAWKTHAESPQERPRPRYVFLVRVQQIADMQPDTADRALQ